MKGRTSRVHGLAPFILRHKMTHVPVGNYTIVSWDSRISCRHCHTTWWGSRESQNRETLEESGPGAWDHRHVRRDLQRNKPVFIINRLIPASPADILRWLDFLFLWRGTSSTNAKRGSYCLILYTLFASFWTWDSEPSRTVGEYRLSHMKFKIHLLRHEGGENLKYISDYEIIATNSDHSPRLI